MLEILAIAAFIGLLPAFIAQSKGHSFMVFWLFGALLFIVALPVALLMSKDQAVLDRRALSTGVSQKCPQCAELVRADATTCRHCGASLGSTTDARRLDAAQPIFLKGNGDADFDIVGESFYQVALDRVAGGKTAEGHELDAEADLIFDPENDYDPNAVKVVIDGLQVGSLSREHAAAYRQRMERLGFDGRTARCDAVIVGGWERSSDSGHYGVRLDLAWPVKPVA